jgi:hypothetical protein
MNSGMNARTRVRSTAATLELALVDQPPVGADDAGSGGLRQLQSTVGGRVIEVVAEDREHSVEGEALPQLDSEKVDETDRLAEQRAFGGPVLHLSYCGHAVTMPPGQFLYGRQLRNKAGQRFDCTACRSFLGPSTFRVADIMGDHPSMAMPAEPVSQRTGKVTPIRGRPEGA